MWTTAGYDLSRVAHGFLASGETDFTTCYLKNSSILELFKGLRPKMIADGVKYRAEHPGEPLKYYYMPPVLNELFRSLDDYEGLRPCRYAPTH
ncbi:hypothetical protein JQX13_47130 [Archangium violaceum]|uniref:hypothetical protein n=1 Tax=Archangium violaceum TaxID=83451 RepID=UPI00193C33A3|nr:hypothetical protein [Archangium violaceum]QRK07501.1 hypothetical protein JQX13_47130 [Archangium violaceum]